MTPHPAPLLRTKLSIPPPRQALLRRDRLLALLEDGSDRPVTLVAAGAGFGKSTLVGQWLAERMKDEGRRMKPGSVSAHLSSFILHPSSFAWLTLDAGDNDPVRFWRYLLAAVSQAVPGLGDAASAMLHGPQPGAVEAVITTLLNGIHDAAQPLVLVLDDYHLIEQGDIHRSLAYAIDHLPAHAHLVLLSREDPPLPLSRWRARGQMAELRADQLRFTRDEAHALLSGPLGLRLAPELTATLEARTEGWAAGLQLAALSLRGQADPAAFIAQFSASHRTALDYLIDEVVAQQPAEVQQFLLRTSILDRMCAELCDAVLKDEGGTMKDEDLDPNFIPHPSSLILAQLERANLFLIPLDGEGRWYRYHQLFGVALRQRLQRQAPDLRPGLHRRAAAWLAAAGPISEAIDHALAANDYAQAADLIETATIPTWLYGEIATVQRWLAALSADACAARPALLLWRAWNAVMLSDWAVLDQAVAAAEPALAAQEPADSPRWGELLALKGWRAALRGDVAAGYGLIVRALALLSPDDAFKRGFIGCQATQAAWALGDHDAVSAQAAEAIVQSDRSDNRFLASHARLVYAWILTSYGQLSQVVALVSEARATAEASALAQQPVHAICHAMMAEVALLRDDPAVAQQHIDATLLIIKTGMDRGSILQILQIQIGIAWARGDQAAIEPLLVRLERELRALGGPELERAGRGLRAWLALLAGQVPEATALLETAPLDAPPLIAGAVTLARALLGVLQGRPAAALALLAPEPRAAILLGAPVEILVAPLRTLALAAMGRPEDADQTLADALARAAPEGLLRPFLDLGPLLAPSLRRLRQTLPDRHPARPLADLVLARRGAAQAAPAAPQRQPAARGPQPLVEPLSAREIEVLLLLAEGATNQQIADRLLISERTAKKHVLNILGKLSAANRTQAVALARTIGLLP